MSSSGKSFESSVSERYADCQTEISLLMSHFFAGYLREIYRAFEGDLALVIVLAEIAHHNTGEHFTTEKGLNEELGGVFDEKVADSGLPACNAFSLAQSTGLPRETVRRKIARLEALGWVERKSRREVQITPKVAEIFFPDFNFNLMLQLLDTAQKVSGVLRAGERPETR